MTLKVAAPDGVKVYNVASGKSPRRTPPRWAWLSLCMLVHAALANAVDEAHGPRHAPASDEGSSSLMTITRDEQAPFGSVGQRSLLQALPASTSAAPGTGPKGLSSAVKSAGKRRGIGRWKVTNATRAAISAFRSRGRRPGARGALGLRPTQASPAARQHASGGASGISSNTAPSRHLRRLLQDGEDVGPSSDHNAGAPGDAADRGDSNPDAGGDAGAPSNSDAEAQEGPASGSGAGRLGRRRARRGASNEGDEDAPVEGGRRRVSRRRLGRRGGREDVGADTDTGSDGDEGGGGGRRSNRRRPGRRARAAEGDATASDGGEGGSGGGGMRRRFRSGERTVSDGSEGGAGAVGRGRRRFGSLRSRRSTASEEGREGQEADAETSGRRFRPRISRRRRTGEESPADGASGGESEAGAASSRGFRRRRGGLGGRRSARGALTVEGEAVEVTPARAVAADPAPGPGGEDAPPAAESGGEGVKVDGLASRRLLGVMWGEHAVVEHPHIRGGLFRQSLGGRLRPVRLSSVPQPPPAPPAPGVVELQVDGDTPRTWRRVPWQPPEKGPKGPKHVGDHRLERHFAKGKNHGGGLAARLGRYQVMSGHPKGHQLYHDATKKHKKKGKGG